MAGILSRILEKSCPTFIMGQRRLIAKTAAIQDDKVERKMGKEARKEERREIVKEITKGYFADLREFRKNGGKRFFALGRPSELKDSLPFPDLKARNLAKKEVDLQKVFPGHVTLLLLWFRGFGEVNVVDGLFFKPFSKWFERNLRAQRPVERHNNYLCFSGNAKSIKERFLENTIVGHAFLVDGNGLVRWKAHANPTDEEIKFMLDCSKLMLKDTYNHAGSNYVTSNSR
ncbi:uncharacterized protein LOC114962080 isoform X2 [Acropora millepora]|uniref:uncharacterized protein LOC114962080 isoform X2 n=1 Tax=Acropora millepora TaxID=45264 RepID=UPI001CF1FEE5|nr:uncharacterized protein LOC114962080 isoform X2 [Acropora millepora]